MASRWRLGALFVCWGVLATLAGAVHSARDVPVYHVQAVAGDPVYLPCDIATVDDPHGNPDSVILVLWYKEDLGTPIFSVDARERDFRQAERWSDENVFGNRAYFMPEKQPAELGVDHIRDTDQGVYRCRVDFKTAQTRNSKVNLTVIVPPNKLVIYDENHVERTSVVGPYMEGSDLILTCQVYGGKPPPSVLWYRGDDILTNRTVVSDDGSSSSSQVALYGLGREDLRSELTCRAWNNNKTVPLSSTVHLDMNFRPLDVHILVSSQPLSAGRRYDLLCQSSGSRPQAKITWRKDKNRLESIKETVSDDGNTTTSTLSFTVSKEDSGKNLTCRAENPTVSSEILETTWTLHVHYIPETKLTLGTSLNKDNIREGTDVYFDCMVVAEPSVYKVEWRHNGKMLNHNVNHGIIISNQSLVLQGVSRASAGNYTCVGYNTEGDGTSQPFNLDVLYAPTCRPDQTRVHGVAKRERANISCQVDANPTDVNFKWTFNSSAESLDVESKYILRSGTSSVVTYTPVSEHDYGTLLCWASNRIGHQRAPCVFHIIAAGRPDQVHNCSVANTSMTSFVVRCSEGFNGGLPQSFAVEVRETDSQLLKGNWTAPVPQFSLSGLEPGAQYQACVYSVNVKGRSEPVVVQAATLRLPEKQLTNEQSRPAGGFRLTPVLSVVTGVVSALLVVACVVVAVLRVHCTCTRASTDSRRKRHKLDVQQRANSGSLCDKPASLSPSKQEPAADSGGDSDEKNPDLIPQPVAGFDAEDAQLDFPRKRQLVSTIETRSSPSRSLLRHGPAQFPGYCTLRNGALPLHHLSSHTLTHTGRAHHLQGSVDSLYVGAGTLPRSHRAPPPPHEPALAPLTKRESTV